MAQIIKQLTANITLHGTLGEQVAQFLKHHDCPKTAAHCGDVARQSAELAQRFSLPVEQATQAGWLHDVSAVFPARDRVEVAHELGVEVLPEEATFPMIIHQKLSVVLAREIFAIRDEAILSAIGCHTTLKQDASPLDTLVFVADKIAWDQQGTPPYLEEITQALNQSLDHAALVYLRYLWNMRDKLRVWHPWANEAYLQLSAQVQ